MAKRKCNIKAERVKGGKKQVFVWDSLCFRLVFELEVSHTASGQPASARHDRGSQHDHACAPILKRLSVFSLFRTNGVWQCKQDDANYRQSNPACTRETNLTTSAPPFHYTAGDLRSEYTHRRETYTNVIKSAHRYNKKEE